VADWDGDSPRLRNNLIDILRDARDRALRRNPPIVADARGWQRRMMAGLDVPDRRYVGRFRGERGLETARVWIDAHEGVPPGSVAAELADFERTLRQAVASLDARYPPGGELDADGLAAVLDLCAWTHAEWVRIHPFGNGNGRTARIWANALLMRYGVPPVVRLRPRPDAAYARACAAAMEGEWTPTASVFREMLAESVR
jgi:fido (protein-threonine AMPylation protein)